MNLVRSNVAMTFMLVACASAPAAAPPSSPAPPAPVTEPVPSSASDPGSLPADAGAGASASASVPGAKPDESGTPKERLMRSHFREAAVIRQTVIDGSLGDAVTPAAALAKTEGLGKIEPGWQSSIDVLQYAARRIQHGSDIPAVAAAVADIGIACGACHKAAGGPRVKVDAPPSFDGSMASRMHRHAWASERLWEGIYAPSDASWKAGAAALSGEPFPKEVLDRGDVHARSAASRFKSLVAAASVQRTPAERGQLYASLLETCSACHVVTRKK